MTRERVLLIILAVLLVFVVPFYFMDHALSARRSEVRKLEAAAGPARAKAEAIRQREAALTAHDAALAALDGGFVLQDPPREIRSHLDKLAVASGVSLGSFVLQPAAPVADLPGVVRYNASIQVSGSQRGLIAFLQGLEESPYLISVPDLAVSFRQAGAREYVTGEVAVPLQLSFFSKVQAAKP